MSYSMAYIGCLMLNPEVLLKSQVPLEAIEPAYQPLYKAILNRVIENKPVDPANLARALSKTEGWPGAIVLAQMLDEAVVPAKASYYAEELHKEFKHKKLTRLIEKVQGAIGNMDPDEALARLQSSIVQLYDLSKKPPYESFSAISEDYLRDGGVLPSIITQIEALDAAWLLDKGGLHVIAGRPGMGKTSFACWLVTKILAQNIGVMFFSLEMPRIQLANKLFEIWTADLTKQEIVALHKNDPLFISDKPSQKIEDIILVSQMVCRHKKIGLIVVDYLQLIKTSERYQSREQQVSAISASLKEIARQCECPVVALCQLNRQVEVTSDKRPALSHLRESGSIEQDSDSVSLIYRPEYYYRIEKKPVPVDQEGLAEFIIAKQRNRDTATLLAKWDRKTGEWYDWRDINEKSFAGRYIEPTKLGAGYSQNYASAE